MNSQLTLIGSLKETARRLSPREKLSLGAQVLLRYFSSLLDILGIALFGTLALIATNGPMPDALNDALKSVFPATTDQATLLGFIAFTVMFLFLIKGFFSSWLTWLFASTMARIERHKMASYSSQAIEAPSNRKNAFSEPEVAHALTVGVAALFPKTIGNFGTVVSELLSVGSIIVLLAFVSPAVTTFAAAYFALVGFILQGILGNKMHRESSIFASSQVESAQNLREALLLYPELKLSGRLDNFVGRFHKNRSLAIASMSKIFFMGALPRYVVEGAFMVGAFSLAIFVFANYSFATAAATFSIFIASGGRIAPSLITLMNSLTALRQTVPEVAQSMKVLRDIV